MSKRIAFTFVWSATFLVVSAVLLFVAWRVYFWMTGAPAQRPSENTLMWFGASVVIIPLLHGGIGIALGIRGALPGTRKAINENI